MVPSRCSGTGRLSLSGSLPRSRPAQRAQNSTVRALPKAMSTTSTGMKAGAEADASMAIHLASSAPKGGSIMVTMPNSVMTATRGMILYRPRMDSMSREPMCCSMVPTQRKRRPLETAWKMMSRMAAVMAAGVAMPAHAMMSPRLAMVE